MDRSSPAVWDAAAADYQKVFRRGQNSYNQSLFRYWEENAMLRPGCRVLDIGCGVGKYGVLFAQRGCDVTLVDFSPEMLRHAAENMAAFSTPWRTFCCDFTQVSGTEEVFARGFDLSISTMSGAICDTETVRKMSAMTRGWCFLSRFRSWEQPMRDRVLRLAGEELRPFLDDPAGDCEDILAAVAAAGYEPRMQVVDYDWCDERSPEELVRVLLRGEQGPSRDTQALLRAAHSLSEGGLLSDAVHTTVAWISWRT